MSDNPSLLLNSMGAEIKINYCCYVLNREGTTTKFEKSSSLNLFPHQKKEKDYNKT